MYVYCLSLDFLLRDEEKTFKHKANTRQDGRIELLTTTKEIT